MKKCYLFFVFFVALILIISCSNNKDSQKSNSQTTDTIQEAVKSESIITRSILTTTSNIITVDTSYGETKDPDISSGYYNVPTESIYLNIKQKSIEVGDSVSLTATILPYNATNKTIIWSSSDEIIATVDKNGIVYTKNAGNVTITATNGDIAEKCNITVKINKQDALLSENLRHAHAINVINDDYNAYKSIINTRITEIKRESTLYYGSKSDYENEMSQLLQKINNIKFRLDIIARDNSAEAGAERALLQDQLLKEQAKLDILNNRYLAKTRVEALEDMLFEHKNKTDKLIFEENSLHNSNMQAIING